MQDNLKKMRLFSMLFVILGICDVVEFVGQCLSGDVSPALFSATLGEAGMIVFIIILVISMLVALVKVILGVLGLMQCKGSYKGKAHLTLAKVCFVFVALGLAMDLVGFFTGSGSIPTLLTSVISVMIMVEYLKLGTELYSRQ